MTIFGLDPVLEEKSERSFGLLDLVLSVEEGWISGVAERRERINDFDLRKGILLEKFVGSEKRADQR